MSWLKSIFFQSNSSVPPSLRTTHEYTEALKAVRDMSSDDEPRDTVVSLLAFIKL